MQKKFDTEQAFKSIIGQGSGATTEQPDIVGKGRPKAARETKKAVSLTLLPSIYEDFKKIAYIDRTSTSELISKLMEKHIKDNAAKIKEYDKIKKSEL